MSETHAEHLERGIEQGWAEPLVFQGAEQWIGDEPSDFHVFLLLRQVRAAYGDPHAYIVRRRWLDDSNANAEGFVYVARPDDWAAGHGMRYGDG